MYNNLYQPNIDRINAQMQELEKLKQQLQQPQQKQQLKEALQRSMM